MRLFADEISDISITAHNAVKVNRPIGCPLKGA